jgi:hypothetical protein
MAVGPVINASWAAAAADRADASPPSSINPSA